MTWLLGLLGTLAALVTGWAANRRGRSAGVAEERGRTATTAAQTTATIARTDAELAAKASEEHREVRARVADPAAPTEAEADAALARFEARGGGSGT